MRIDSPPTRFASPPSPTSTPGAPSSPSIAAVVVPIRAFTDGGARLATALSPRDRAALGRQMAERVVTAAGDLPIVIVTSAPEVIDWAASLGIATVPDPGGLDAAVAAGSEWARRGGCRRVVVAHADLPRARPGALVRFAADAGCAVLTIVPCHRDDGSPVLSVPLERPFPFAYGPGSFRRHVESARAAGLAVKVVRDPDLGFDLDLPEDLAALDPGWTGG